MAEAEGAAAHAEFVPYDFPFNAAYAWRRDRQLAPYMLTHGSSAAPMNAAIDALLAEIPVSISIDPCERHPFYILSNLAAPPLSPPQYENCYRPATCLI